MRPIGFSTGALAYADFRLGLRMLENIETDAVELSALRHAELRPMVEAVPSLDLTRFKYVSIHAPSQFAPEWEAAIWADLESDVIRSKGWPIVLHPDAIHDFGLWRELGRDVCIENMDKRKLVGRTVKELARVFDELPDATLCFDIGHARQVDPTMTEAWLILREFGARLRQVHVSEVNSASRHDALSYSSMASFQEVTHLIPEDVPLILETPVSAENMAGEIAKVRRALPLKTQTIAA